MTQLQRDVARFESLAGKAKHVDSLQTEFLQLLDSIDAVLGEYEHLSVALG